MPKPKKGDPELLLVSFCDIVTIVTAALFMAMIVVIDESSRIASVRPMPLLRSTTNAPVYFECREGQVFPVDRAGLTEVSREKGKIFAQSHPGGPASVDSGAGSSNKLLNIDVKALAEVLQTEAGNELYRIVPGYLAMGIRANIARGGGKGTTVKELMDSTENPFHQAIARLDPESQYCLFIVRDDGFEVFRRARDLAAAKKFQCGWQVLSRNEPIIFAGRLDRPGVQ